MTDECREKVSLFLDQLGSDVLKSERNFVNWITESFAPNIVAKTTLNVK